MRLHLSLALLPVASAFQLPFKIPFFSQSGDSGQQPLQPANSKPRIAIIGAGAGGTSAAFWISKAKERFGIDVDVDVYEKESYIGGRAYNTHFLYECADSA
jgi:prenylcysteine oxidase/farnesylcysteine lyase